jgi:8-oxo-dGTP pyrophosphatase MutT (NUDIX family)
VTPVYTVALLLDPPGERVLLLERAAWKAYAPGRLTGIGCRAEPGEAPEAAAWRELREETGIGPADVAGWRAWAIVACPDEGIELFHSVARALRAPIPPACSEGILCWVRAADLSGLDMIENTAAVLRGVLSSAPPDTPRRGICRGGVLIWC